MAKSGPLVSPDVTGTTLLTCAVCGHAFDPAEHPSCSACPLHQGCSLACCPNCGASNINPAGSRLATWLKKLIGDSHA